jgi:hypothetical protein
VIQSISNGEIEMKNLNFVVSFALMLLILTLTSCGGGGGGFQPDPLPEGEDAVTQAELKGAVSKSAFVVGNAPSRFSVKNGFLYTVNALENTVSVHSATDYTLQRTLSMPVGAGPYDILFSGDNGYICASGSNAVYRFGATSAAIDATTVSFLDTMNEDYAFVGPGEMAVVGGKLYVPLSGISTFGDPSQGVETTYGQGRVAVINIASFTLEGFITLDYANPTVCAAGMGGALYIVCTGESQFNADFTPYAGSDGALVVYDTNSDEVAYSLELGETLPSAFFAFNTAEAYIGSNLNGEVYRVRLDTGVIMRGNDNPIVLTDDFTFISSFTGLPGMGVLAGSFNTDEVYFLDPNDDSVSKTPFSEPFDFTESETFFGGVQDILFDATNGKEKLFVLMGVANSVSLVDLSDLWDRIRVGMG